jgi:high-affinity iron transporter
MVENIEEAFLGLREQGRSSVSVERFAQDARTLENMLIEAEAVLGSPSGWRIPFFASLLILLRESLESALLVLLLLGLARRAGAARDVGAVHAGWSAAVIAGLITWLATGAIIAMGGASRELVEGVISLTAAVVLVYASHFVLARLDAKRRVEALRERFRSASPAQRYWVLFFLGFVAVYREVFEVVLFLRALLVEAPEARRFVALGSAAGVASSGLVILAVRTLGRRMNPGMVLGGSGALLCGLAIILTGKGIHALQEAGFVGVSRIGVPRIEWLGLYPTLQTVAAQTLTVAIIVVVAAGGTHALRRAAETGVAP